MSDPRLIDGLRLALEAAPGSVALRLQLIEALLAANRFDEATVECGALLSLEPDNESALDVAARAAEATGDDKRAARYRRVLAGIQWSGLDPAALVPAAGDEGVAPDAPSEGRDPDVELPTVALDDVGGLINVKKRLRASFLDPMHNPELREAFGKSLRGGLLLYGPPGCGKTFLARAVAGELGARFISVGLHQVLDMWLGQSERNVHEVFQTARRNAPCVLFCDEVDALGQKRIHLRHSAGRNVVVQFLAEMDGAKYSNDGVFVLGATNHPWDIDAALRRPGRFDRTLLVLPPDREARISILAVHLRGKPQETVDLVRIAERTEGYSGADLSMVCESAAELAMQRSLDEGRVSPITNGDLALALEGIRPSTRAWFETARNYAEFSNASGEYDELLTYIRKNL